MSESRNERQFYADVSRIADNLENITNILEQIRVELKHKRHDDSLTVQGEKVPF